MADNMRWLRFRIAAFFKEYYRLKRENYWTENEDDSSSISEKFYEDRDWAYSVYDRADSVVFPDVGIYILYFDEFGPRGVGSPYSVYKIGLSDRMRKRWSMLQTGTPIDLMPLHVIESGTLHWTEGWLHNALRSRRISDDREWFALSMDDLKTLLSISVLNKPKGARDEAVLLTLYERFNPPDASQERMF